MKDRLFELIRSEKVIIFAGAGTSMSSGYPSGNQLKEILHNSLNSHEREKLEINLPLPNFVENYCRIKNDQRKSLNRILINEFVHKVPKTISWHKKLSRVSHFKTIITTNYDSLFEKGYGDNAKVIFKSSHLANISNQTEVFKIHGCISEVESIIITNTDYNNFFKSNLELSVFWSTVKSRMAMNSILFLGYSLEDPNIRIIFEKICEELGKEREDVFFMSPNLPDYNIEYLKKLDITYINMTAKTFLNQLTKNIEDNVVSDFNNKKITANTLFKYSHHHGLYPNLINENGDNIVNSFTGINKNINPVVTINFADGIDFKSEVSNFEKQKNFESLIISEDKILASTFSYGKFKMPQRNLSKIVIIPQPVYQTKIDIIFDNGFEYYDVSVQIFKKDNFAKIVVHLKNAICTIEYDFEEANTDNDFSLTYNHKDKFGRVNDEIEEMKILYNIGLGINFNTFQKNVKNPLYHHAQKNPEFIDFADMYLKYFEKLKIIQNHYSVRFDGFRFDTISLKTENLVNYIISVINDETIEKHWKGFFKIEMNDELRDLLHNKNQWQHVFPFSDPEIISLHGISIDLGYPLIQLKNMEILNFEEIMNESTNVAKLVSSDDILLIKYTKEKIINTEKGV